MTQPGVKAHPGRDHIKVRGRLLPLDRRLEYFAYHKPVGCVTTMKDPRGRYCVGDVVAALGKSLFPVGRLDINSTGFVLLTNDGELAARITHPRYEIEKTYRVKVSRPPTDGQLQRLRRGVRLYDGLAKPLRIRVERRTPTKAWLVVVVCEGRKHQVRRMMESVGLKVDKLKRTAIASLRIGRQAPDSVRRLRAEEVAALRCAVGLGK